MLKPFLIAGSMMIVGSAFAQAPSGTSQAQPATAPSSGQRATATQTAPAPTVSTAPTGDAMTAQSSPATPAPTAPAGPAVTAPTTDSTVEPGTTPPVQAAPAPAPAQSGGSQVEQIIAREFGAYDRNKDGRLSQLEFDTWMVALKTASDPATRADAPATKQWLGAAFAQADADKSRDVTQTELTGFLTQGQS